ncbi:MAG: hypothetical protein H6594_06730 [Flavobacteriales bacterium]|nr:hypothetical protein [Flavobacteriales bacterium]
MDSPAAEVIVPVIFFATIFGIVYLAIMSKYRQRMAMIEKGIAPADMMEKSDPHRTLKWGMVCVGVGIGLFIGYLLDTYMMADQDSPLPYFIAVTLCAGGALIWSYSIIRRKQQG